MNIDNTYTRRVRIQGLLGEVDGYKLTVHDIETGQALTNVYAAVIMIDANSVNKATLSYHVADEAGIFVDPETDRSFTGQAITLDPEIDVTCLEVENQ